MTDEGKKCSHGRLLFRASCADCGSEDVNPEGLHNPFELHSASQKSDLKAKVLAYLRHRAVHLCVRKEDWESIEKGIEAI